MNMRGQKDSLLKLRTMATDLERIETRMKSQKSIFIFSRKDEAGFKFRIWFYILWELKIHPNISAFKFSLIYPQEWFTNKGSFIFRIFIFFFFYFC